MTGNGNGDGLLLKMRVLGYDANRLETSTMRPSPAGYHPANSNAEPSIQARPNSFDTSDASARRISTQQRDDGLINWALIAGGAIATALSMVIGRNRRRTLLTDEGIVRPGSEMASGQEKGADPVSKQSSEVCNPQRNSVGDRNSELSRAHILQVNEGPDIVVRLLPEKKYCQLCSDWGETGACSTLHFCWSKLYVGHESKLFTRVSPGQPQWEEAGSVTKPTPLGRSDLDLCSMPAACPDISGKRGMVHKLRQQLKRRDEMMLKMQARLLEQERIICMQRSHSAGLEVQVETGNKSLIEAEKEIQRLCKAMAGHYSMNLNQPRGEFGNYLESLNECSNNFEVKRARDEIYFKKSQENHEQPGEQTDDMTTFISEARRLAEELKHAQDEKGNKEALLSAQMEKQEQILQEVHCLEIHLANARAAARENDSLLKSYERERAKLLVEKEELEQRLTSQTKGINCKRHLVSEQQHIEEEISEHSNNKAKILELRDRVTRLAVACDSGRNEAHNEHTERVRMLSLELAKNISIQEEKARIMSHEAQRLSVAFQQLSSKPKVFSSCSFCERRANRKPDRI